MKALAFLAGDSDALIRFMNLSGVHPQDLRQGADDPQLLGAVLDFVLGDDKLLLAFTQAQGLDTKLIHEARRALPGFASEG